MKKPVQDMSLMQAESENIVLFYPHVSELAKKSVLETLDSRWIGQGPKVKLFEENFSKNLVLILLQLRLALELMRYICLIF